MLVSGLLLALLVAAAALTQSRVAGDITSVDLPDPAVLTEMTVAPESEAPQTEAENQGQSSSSVKVDLDIDASSSSKVNVDFSSSVDGSAEIKVPDQEAEEKQGSEPLFNFTINGQTISCLPGETWRNEDRSVKCENDENREFKVRFRSR